MPDLTPSELHAQERCTPLQSMPAGTSIVRGFPYDDRTGSWVDADGNALRTVTAREDEACTRYHMNVTRLPACDVPIRPRDVARWIARYL